MTKLRAGDRCPCCGQPITTSSPERLAILQQLADAMGCERTCGTCPVAMAVAKDSLVMCPFVRGFNSIRLLREPCKMEVVE